MEARARHNRLLLPFLAPLYRALEPLGYPLIRFATGAILIPHGYEKLFQGGSARLAHSHSIPGLGLHPIWFWAYAVGAVEFFAAIFLAVGFLTRLAAASIAVEMIVITFFLEWKNGYLWTHQGYEFSLMWALICIGVACRGPGGLSVDRAIGWEL
jgi:putative oxidoreductase